MDGGRDGSWRNRVEAAAARGRDRDASYVQQRFGGSAAQTLLRELPWGLAFGFAGYLLLGWEWAIASVVVMLGGALLFRAWARRRYGIGSPRPDGQPDPES